MLHDMVWKGLRSDLKAITHYNMYKKGKYTAFDALRVALRKTEKKNILDQPAKPVLVNWISKKAAARTETDAVEEEPKKAIRKHIVTRLDRLESGW